MKSPKINLLIITVLFTTFFGCKTTEEQKITLSKGNIKYDYHKDNIGQIFFMDKLLNSSKVEPIHNLNEIVLSEGNEFFLRLLPEFSQTHYLSILSPNISANELCELGNWSVKFYINDEFVYEDNIHPGAGSCSQRNQFSEVIVPLIANKDELNNHWGSFLWKRFFYREKHEKLFIKGTNKLTLEFRPYIETNGDLSYGDIIAKGSVLISLKEEDVDEKLIKTQIIEENDEWKIANQNFDKTPIRQVNKKIAQGKYKNVSSILVSYDGKLLIEEYFNGSNRETLHDTKSVGKSFVGTLMGLAIANGHIKDENLTLDQFYNLNDFENFNPKKNKVSIKDLLTMSSSFLGNDMDISSPGNEENMYPTKDWVKFTLDLPIDDSKLDTARWEYFTSGSVLLGDILNKSVPDNLEVFAEKNLFSPLNIKNYKWQYTPNRVVNTAGSLQLSTLDLAKYGVLYQQNGLWNNKQIVPKNWVEKSKSSQIHREQETQKGYGYQLWHDKLEYNGKEYNVSYASGNGGNRIMIFEEIPLVIVITATLYGNPMGHSQANQIVEDYLLPLVSKYKTTID